MALAGNAVTLFAPTVSFVVTVSLSHGLIPIQNTFAFAVTVVKFMMNIWPL